MALLTLKKIKQINFCPYFYYLNNILKKPYVIPEKTQFKEEIKNIVLYYIKSKLQGEEPSEEKLRNIVGKTFAKDATEIKYKITSGKQNNFLKAAQYISYLRLYSQSPNTWKDIVSVETVCAVQIEKHVLEGVIDLIAKDSKKNFYLIIPSLTPLKSLSLDFDVLFQELLFRKKYNKSLITGTYIYQIDRCQITRIEIDSISKKTFENNIVNIGNILDSNFFDRKMDQFKCRICYLKKECKT